MANTKIKRWHIELEVTDHLYYVGYLSRQAILDSILVSSYRDLPNGIHVKIKKCIPKTGA